MRDLRGERTSALRRRCRIHPQQPRLDPRNRRDWISSWPPPKINHSGDSDSTGSIAGNLLGLVHGEEGIPSRWREQVELAEVVSTVADDLFNAFVERRDGEPYQPERYPGV